MANRRQPLWGSLPDERRATGKTMKVFHTSHDKTGRSKLLALVAGMSLASILIALAAGLGGLNIGRLGAERGDVSTYSGGIEINWDNRTYDTTTGEFVVAGLTLTPMDDNKPFPTENDFDAVLARSDGSILYRAPAVEVTDGTKVTITVPGGISVADLSRVAVSLEARPVP